VSVDPKSPWRVVMFGDAMETQSSEERLHAIRESTDRAWLKRVAGWAGTQRTVIEAALRRLRVLTKKKATQ
jgi:hypothetical protein